MKFENPDILFWLWALIPVAGIMVFGALCRKGIMDRFAKASLHPVLVPGYEPGRRWIKAALIVLALVLALFALAGPRMGFRWEKATQKGVDIMIALDCSRSMLATDVRPSRLERAKREIVDLLNLMTSDRAGLVAFAGQAILQCPLTLDHEAFNIFLRVLEPDYLPVGGTNLKAAMETCFSGFEKDSDTDKAIILITDGENTAGDVDETVKKMAEQNIKVFCIGVGDPKGAPVPDSGGGFKKDAKGNIIMSRVDEGGLKNIAAMTNGRYVRSVAGDMDLDLIYTKEILGSMERKTLDQGKKKVWEQRFQWFLLPCVLLLLLEFWLPVTKLKRLFPFLAMAYIMVSLVPGAAQAQSHVKKGVEAFEAQKFEQAKKHFIDAQLEDPDDPRLYYNIGTAAYMNQEYDLAEKNFAQAARSQDPEMMHRARFNLANTRYRMGKLKEAVLEYEGILDTFPEDKRAKENLAFVKQKIQEQDQQQNQSCENPGSKDEGGDKKEKSKDKGGQKEQDSQAQKEKDPQGKKKDGSQSPDGRGQKEQGQASAKDQKEPDQTQEAENLQGGRNPEENQKTAQEPKSSGEAQAQDQTRPEENQGAGHRNGGAVAAGKQAPFDKTMENKLNRLEDKPGMALMPGTGAGQAKIKKDW